MIDDGATDEKGDDWVDVTLTLQPGGLGSRIGSTWSEELDKRAEGTAYAEAAYRLVNFVARNMSGVEVLMGGKPYKRADKKKVVEWIKDRVPGVPGQPLSVAVGMLNGLLTRISDFAGAQALRLAETVLRKLGFACCFIGTNDDSHGAIGVPNPNAGTEKITVEKTIKALTTALTYACRVYGIEVNAAKMNCSTIVSELNTAAVVERADGKMSVILPGERSALGSVRHTCSTNITEEQVTLMSACSSGAKEGADTGTLFAVAAFRTMNVLETSKLLPIALATATGIPIPGGHLPLGVSVAPHLNGIPMYSPATCPFPATAQIAAKIVQRLLKSKGKDGKPATVNGVGREDLIQNVCRILSIDAIASQSRTLSDNRYSGENPGAKTKEKFPSKKTKDDLADGIGPWNAMFMGAPTVYLLKDGEKSIFSKEFLDEVDVVRNSVGLRNSAASNIVYGLRTIANTLHKQSTRLLCRIFMRALGGASNGGVPPPNLAWNEHADTSDLPKRYRIWRTTYSPDKGWGKVEGEVSLWWLTNAWARFNWEKPVEIDSELTDTLMQGMTDNVHAILKLWEHLSKAKITILQGSKLISQRTPMGLPRPPLRLGQTELTRLLDPNRERVAALVLESLTARANNAELSATDLSILGAPGVKISRGDLEVVKRIASALSDVFDGDNLEGWVLPGVLASNPTPLDAAYSIAACMMGRNIRVLSIVPLMMPREVGKTAVLPIAREQLETAATDCVIRFVSWEYRHPRVDDNYILGMLPDPGKVRATTNTLSGSNFAAKMIGFQIACTWGMKLSLNTIDLRIFSCTEFNSEVNVFIHYRPGVALRNMTDVHFRKKQERALDKKGKPIYGVDGKPVLLGKPDKDIIHSFCITYCSTVLSPVTLKSGVVLHRTEYQYKHIVICIQSREDLIRSGKSCVIKLKNRGKAKYTMIDPAVYSTGEATIMGDKVSFLWNAEFNASVACYPPHMGLLVKGTDYFIPIKAIDCRQGMTPESWAEPIRGPEFFTSSKKYLNGSQATTSLEWAVESPTPYHAFEMLPTQS